MPVFKTGAINRSATPPGRAKYSRCRFVSGSGCCCGSVRRVDIVGRLVVLRLHIERCTTLRFRHA